jgi:hypothetical protein
MQYIGVIATEFCYKSLPYMEADPVTSADPDSFGCEEVERVCFQFLPDVSPPGRIRG